jgi:hypothetical protein
MAGDNRPDCQLGICDQSTKRRQCAEWRGKAPFQDAYFGRASAVSLCHDGKVQMRNSIEFSIPLALGNGRTVRTSHCTLTADYLEGYTLDPIQREDAILLDFVIGSGGATTESARKEYLVTHAHPESCDGQPCMWFMAVPRAET